MKTLNIIFKASQTPKLVRWYVKSFALLLILSLTSSGCNENTFLNEEPLDFFSPSNSFVTIDHFESAIANLYANYRSNFWGRGGVSQAPRLMFYGTDLVMNDKDLGTSPPDWSALLRPTESRVSHVWVSSYEIIFDANVIIERADSEISQLTEEEKTLVKGEASFFRGLTYRILANLYGGVPLVLEEITSPRRDFTRSSRAATYEQAASDLRFAAQNLMDISATPDHRVSKEAANHLPVVRGIDISWTIRRGCTSGIGCD